MTLLSAQANVIGIWVAPPFPREGGIIDSKSKDGIIDLTHFEIKNGIRDACSTADIITAGLLVVY